IKLQQLSTSSPVSGLCVAVATAGVSTLLVRAAGGRQRRVTLLSCIPASSGSQNICSPVVIKLSLYTQPGSVVLFNVLAFALARYFSLISSSSSVITTLAVSTTLMIGDGV